VVSGQIGRETQVIMHKSLRYLGGPLLVFFGLLLLGRFSQEILQQLGVAAEASLQHQLAHLIRVALWLTGAACLARAINLFVWDRLVTSAFHHTVPRLLKDFLALIIFGITLLAILTVEFGQDVTPLWATSGALGVVIGLALRGMILDFFSGLTINLDRSYQIGDWLEVPYRDFKAPIYGRVVQINWRTTHIELENKNIVLVPNSIMGTVALTNYSLPEDLARFEITVALDFAVPPDRGLRVLLGGVNAAVGKDGPVEVPAPRVLVGEIRDGAVEYKVRYFLRVSIVSPSTGRHTVTRCILEHLHQTGLSPAVHGQNLTLERGRERNLSLDTTAGRTALLAKVDLFRKSLGNEDLAALAEGAGMISYGPHERIIRQGDDGASMFILAEGLIYVFVENERQKEEVKIRQLTPGQAFGEMSLLTGEPRSATVTTATDVIVLEIVKEKMHKLLAKRPEVAERLCAVAAERHLELTKVLNTLPPEEHLAHKENAASALLRKMKHFFDNVFQGTSEP